MPALHERMHRLVSSHKKEPMLPGDEPNFFEISSRRPLPEGPVITLDLNTEAYHHPASNNDGASRTFVDSERQEISQIRPGIQNHNTPGVILNTHSYPQPTTANIGARILNTHSYLQPTIANIGARTGNSDYPLLLPASPQGLVYARVPLIFYRVDPSNNSRL